MITDGRLKEIVAGIDIHDSPFPSDPGAKDCSDEVREMAKEPLDRRHGAPSGASVESATADDRAPTALAVAMRHVDQQMERALDEHRNAPTAYRPGAVPALADVVMVAKIDPREPRSLYDSTGREIGHVVIDGDTGTARITDPAVVAAVKALVAEGRGLSMGYRVTLEPVPAEPAGSPPAPRLVPCATCGIFHAASVGCPIR